MFMNKTTAEVKKLSNLQKYMIGSTLKVVGTITTPITIEIPTVENPDVDTDSDWQQATTGSTIWQLDSDNLVLVLDGALGVCRFNKPAGDDVGIDHKW